MKTAFHNHFNYHYTKLCNRFKISGFIVMTLCLLAGSGLSFAQTQNYDVYLAPAVKGNGSGSDWDNAANGNTFLSGLALSGAGTFSHNIYISTGSYTISVPTVALSIKLAAGVKIQGGFPSTTGTNPPTGTDLSGYDPVNNVTTISESSLGTYSFIAAGGVTMKGFKFNGNNGGINSIFHYNSSAGDYVFQDFEAYDCTIRGAIWLTKATSLTFDNCRFNNNKTGYGGGAITSDNTTTTLIIRNSVFTGNNTMESESYRGGAIQAWGPTTIDKSVFCGNFTTNGGGGGAIGNAEHGNTITITSSTFSGNKSFMGGGAIDMFSGTLIATDCNFYSNQCIVNGILVGALGGGAIEHINAVSSKLTRCNFFDNTSNTTTNNPYNSQTYQGGGAISFKGTYAIDHCVFDRNTSMTKGGAIFFNNTLGASTITNSTFKDNKYGTATNVSGSDVYLYGGNSNFQSPLTLNNNFMQLSGPTLYTAQFLSSTGGGNYNNYVFGVNGGNNTFGNMGTSLAGSPSLQCPSSINEICLAADDPKPLLSAYSKSGSCPATTVDLSSITASNQNSDVTLTWHTGTPATSANQVSSPVTAGTYYAAFNDASQVECYSPTSDPVTISITPCLTVSGKVWDDGNGDVVIDPAEPGTNAGGPLYVNLINNTNNVVGSYLVGSDGLYSIPGVPANVIGYKLILTNTANSVIAGNLPTDWVNTGENVGASNTAVQGSGLGEIEVTTTSSALTNQNFGIEKRPDSDSKSFTVQNGAFSSTAPLGYPTLAGYQSIVANSSYLTGYPTGGSLSGTDLEDCNAPSSCSSGATFRIKLIKPNTRVYHESNEILAGDLISGLDASELVIYGQNGSGTSADSFGFDYVLVDAADEEDLSPATYRIATQSALPVTLLSFEVEKENNVVQLKWLTSQETNSERFDVQHSVDSKNWFTLGNITALGESKVSHTYHYTHTIPSEAINYYRLKMVDQDGSFTYSRIRTVEMSGMAAVYPNPASSYLMVPQSAQKIRIYAASGQIQKEEKTENGKIDVSRLSAGVYIIEIYQNGSVLRQKFVVAR